MTQATATLTAPPSKRQTADLPGAVSLYLDLVRLLAALCVFITHAKYPRFTNGWLDSVGRYGSDAVMVFFVLSGLVIAHVTSAARIFLLGFLTEFKKAQVKQWLVAIQQKLVPRSRSHASDRLS